MSNPQNTIPHFDSTDAEWIAWHKALKAYGYKKQEANEMFISAFSVRANQELGGANTYRLREYAKSQGFSIDGGYVGATVDAWGGIGKGIGSMFSSFALFIVLAVFLGILVIGFVLWNTLKN
jgi:hypothetical protein